MATAPTSEANQTHQVVNMFHNKSDENNNTKCFNPLIFRPRYASKNKGANATNTKGVKGIGSQANQNKIDGIDTSNQLGMLSRFLRFTWPIASLSIMLYCNYFLFRSILCCSSVMINPSIFLLLNRHFAYFRITTLQHNHKLSFGSMFLKMCEYLCNRAVNSFFKFLGYLPRHTDSS